MTTEARDVIGIDELAARVADALNVTTDDLSETFADGVLTEDLLPTSADYLVWLTRRAINLGVSITP